MRKTYCVLASAMFVILIGPRPLIAQTAREGAGADFRAHVDELASRVRAHDVSLDELSATVLALEPRAGSAGVSEGDVRAYRTLQETVIARLRARWQIADGRLTPDGDDVLLQVQAYQELRTLMAAMRLQASPDEVALVELQIEAALRRRAIRDACVSNPDERDGAIAAICAPADARQ